MLALKDNMSLARWPALCRNRQQQSDSFLDALAAKYSAKDSSKAATASKKKKSKQAQEVAQDQAEPTEEEFEAARYSRPLIQTSLLAVANSAIPFHHTLSTLSPCQHWYT